MPRTKTATSPGPIRRERPVTPATQLRRDLRTWVERLEEQLGERVRRDTSRLQALPLTVEAFVRDEYPRMLACAREQGDDAEPSMTPERFEANLRHLLTSDIRDYSADLEVVRAAITRGRRSPKHKTIAYLRIFRRFVVGWSTPADEPLLETFRKHRDEHGLRNPLAQAAAWKAERTGGVRADVLDLEERRRSTLRTATSDVAAAIRAIRVRDKDEARYALSIAARAVATAHAAVWDVREPTLKIDGAERAVAPESPEARAWLEEEARDAYRRIWFPGVDPLSKTEQRALALEQATLISATPGCRWELRLLLELADVLAPSPRRRMPSHGGGAQAKAVAVVAALCRLGPETLSDLIRRRVRR